MAQSRLEKIGTIYSRMTALLQSGTIKADYKPIWYDIYEAFPPKYEPRWDREPEMAGEPIPKILYKEDVVRAQFYKQFGDRLEVFDLFDKENTKKPLSEVFIAKFDDLRQNQSPGKSFEDLFAEAIDALEEDGIHLRSMNPEEARKRVAVVPTRFKRPSPAVVRERLEKSRSLTKNISFKELFSLKDDDENSSGDSKTSEKK